MERAMLNEYGGEPNPLDSTGLCLLSLDGGGVRGLSTLYILRSIMSQLNYKRKETASLPPVKPCEVFDLIGGTSTGGLIAIMLGRLEMDVDECISAYSELAEVVFGEKLSPIPFNIKWKVKPRFELAKLQKAVQKIVEEKGASITDLLNDGVERGCRTFVCTVDRDTKDIVRLRSYSLLGESNIRATICQAALATSAATTFFEPVTIGDRTFADGGLGANNPADEVEGEASSVWCSETGDLKPLVKCFISIGTGNPGKKAFEDTIIKFLGQTVVEIAAETETTEKKFIARWAKHFDKNRYFRFNVEQGLQSIGLDEYKKKGAIEAATESYLIHTAQKFRMRDCIQNLRLKQNKTKTSFATTMNESAVNAIQQQSINQITVVPYLENTKFHGREQLLLDIHQFFTAQTRNPRRQRRLVLQGFPGIGKTTVALQYSIDYGNLYDGVFWVTALQSDTIKREYAKLEDEVKKHTSLSFEDWCSSKKWLLIIDNLDDPACFYAQSMIPLGQGDVLITSRRTDLNQIGTVKTIPPLDDKSAGDLLLLYAENRLPEDEDEGNSLKLVQMLGCIPLAIRHCGCLLSEQRSKLSSYIREFDDLMTELALVEELGRGGPRDTFDLNDSKPLLGSFDLSFTHLQRASQDAAAMLSILANLEPTNISIEMLERSLCPHRRWDGDGNITTSYVPGMNEWLRNLSLQARGYGLRGVLNMLVKFSLLFPKMEEGYYFLHPLTHFWLRWKQENAKNLEPFKGALVLLYNGFPHPEFCRTYGLTHRHQDLRETYMPHVQYLLKRYQRLKSFLDEDETSLLQMANLFLQASDTPPELRPMKQRIRANVPGKYVAFPEGDFVDPFEQDTTFLEVLENIMVRLQYPGTIFLYAIYVFFEHICKEWLTSHPSSVFRSQNIKFAGKSLRQVRAMILEQSEEPKMTESSRKESSDLKILMPLIADPKEQSSGNTTLDKQSGILGLITLKYIQHVQESVFEAGPRIEFDAITNTRIYNIDYRALTPHNFAYKWIWHFKSLLLSKNQRICDLTKFAHCQLTLQAYRAKNDTGEIQSTWSDLRLWSINAMIELAGLVGPESVVGAESFFMLVWDGTQSQPPQALVSDVDIKSVLSTPISLDNYYFKIKVIDAWQYNMVARGMLKQAETLILTWLNKFLNCDKNLVDAWNFSLDPVLDLYEYAIFHFKTWAKDPKKASQFQDEYLEYFEKEYGTFDERLYLGCGVGIFGLSHARLRIGAYKRQRRQSAESHVFEMELYLKLKGKLGAAGTSLPNNNPETSRLAEQEWCMCRQRAFREALGLSQPSAFTTFGSVSWNTLYPSETTIDESLFQAEANRVKRLVWEALEEMQPDLFDSAVYNQQ